MPSATLTTEQRHAIDTRDVSIALSAGAGCGKTHVLTERFLSHLLPEPDDRSPTSLAQLVAITFTDAAAREMRSRIRGACYERLQQGKGLDEQNHWLRLLREIDAARVSTIHAFCASLLRAHAATAGLDPTFGVLEQSAADVMQFEVIDDVLRGQLAEFDPETLDLAEAVGLGRLKQQIAVLLGRRHDPAFHEWQDVAPDTLVDRWREWHAHEALPLAIGEIAASAPIDTMVTLLESVDPAGNKKFSEARGILLDFLPRLANHSISETQLDAVREFAKVQTICTKKDWQPAERYDQYRDACTELRAAIDRHKPKPFDAAAAGEAARLGLALLRLTAHVVAEYESRKRAQGRLDFDDLLAAAHALITDPQNGELRQQLADDLRLLLVDEFQDTDQLQVDLVKAICGPGFDAGRLFLVGDFKQSIYRFRGAEPKVFRNLREEVKEKGRLPLTTNFRSQPAILHFVNALFCDAFNSTDQPYETLIANRKQQTAEPAVEFLWTIAPDKGNRKIAGAAREARRSEARAVARRLQELLHPDSTEQPVVDRETNKPRQLQPRDVAILFRTLSDVQVYEEALRDSQLDYYLVGGHAFYAQQEVYDVLNLLRAVASTADEVSLAGVLRSPFFALADETLFWLVEFRGSLNAGLLADELPPPLSEDERTKTAAAADTIRHLRSIRDRVPIAALLAEALDRTGYDAVLLTEFLGERKLANLHKLLEQARAADHGGTIDLDGFITQLAQFIVQEPKESLAATLPEAADVIRLMTIHHAKGLEFPFVVIPDLDRLPRLDTPAAALDRKLGPLIYPPNDDDRRSATGMSMFAALERAEELEERKRMLYVATTRAADYLLLSSSIEAHDKPKSDWMKLLGERFDLATGGVVAALPEGYKSPQIRITPPPSADDKPAGRSRGPDLLKMLEDAYQLAASGAGSVPAEVAPIPVDRAARRQFSFSRLSGQLKRDRRPRPAAIEQVMAMEGSDSLPSPRSASRAGLGSLVHDVLARVDLGDSSAVAAWCEHLAPQHVDVSAPEAAQAARDMIQRFAKSPRGKELAQATAAHREVEFLLAWPSDSKEGGGSLIRGFIDCIYQNADGTWRIADYKTNNVTAAEVPRKAQQYAMQLYVYAMAAERALGQPPAELVLHFLRSGVEHVLPWNDEARRQAIEMVNEAIDQLKGSEFGVQGSGKTEEIQIPEF